MSEIFNFVVDTVDSVASIFMPKAPTQAPVVAPLPAPPSLSKSESDELNKSTTDAARTQDARQRASANSKASNDSLLFTSTDIKDYNNIGDL